MHQSCVMMTHHFFNPVKHFFAGGINPNDVPQMVVITFDDAVNDENW